MDKDTYKMIMGLLAAIAKDLAVVAVIIVTVLFALHYIFDVELESFKATLALGIIGTTLAFAGNSLVSDAVCRFGGKRLIQWKVGNRLQSVGFMLTLFIKN